MDGTVFFLTTTLFFGDERSVNVPVNNGPVQTSADC